MIDKTQFINQPYDSAQLSAIQQGCTLRITILDGELLMVTCDYRPNRLNVSVDAGVVTAVGDFG